MKDDQCFYIVAGEPSGDLHASRLAYELKKKYPKAIFRGIGGQKLKEHGYFELLDFKDFQVMGFTDVLLALPRLYRHFYTVLNDILKINPACVITVDYPGFNLRLAKALRKKKYAGKIVHYIAPSIWAHGKERLKTLEENFDLQLLIYPFEEKHFLGSKLPFQFVGNPVLEISREKNAAAATSSSNFLDREFIALFPGSRPSEIKKNGPKMIRTAEIMLENGFRGDFAISIKDSTTLELLSKVISPAWKKRFHFVPQEGTHDMMKKAKAALAKSGTVTLELACEKCPTVVFYDVGLINWLIAKYYLKLKLPYFCIVNLLANEEVFKEKIKETATPNELAAELFKIVNEGSSRELALQGCEKVISLLGDKKASENAAHAIGGLFV